MSKIVNHNIFEIFNVNINSLAELCSRLGVKNLSVFGSILTPDFNIGQSDLDFLVEFENISFEKYFVLLDGLKDIFKYNKIDLITVGALKNRIISAEIKSSKETLYAA